MSEHLYITAAVEFEAARRVSILPEGHRSRRLHGHSFLASLRSTVPDGWASFKGAEVHELRAALAECISPLDYNDLNQFVTEPTDENLVRYIRANLEVPGVETIGIQSTRHEGVDLARDDHAHIWRRYMFQSAHVLPNVPAGHKCGRMHGHGFEVIIHADQDLGTRDLGVDYDRLDALWEPIYAELDHTCLNDILGLENPTSENISSWIWNRLKPELPELSWVTVYETATCGANFDGEDYRIWKEMTLDSALTLKYAPNGNPRRKIHGHTYTVRLHLGGPIDEVMGWTVDFGDVKELFTPIFKTLDHQPLYEVEGLLDNDCASITRWIRKQSEGLIPQLDRIDLYETRGSGAILSWGKRDPVIPI